MNTDRYYEGYGVECLDIIDALHASFRVGSIIKYVYRAGHKENAFIEDDVRKALDYLDNIDDDDLTASAMDVVEAAYLVSKLDGISDYRRRALLLACLLSYYDTWYAAQEDLYDHLKLIA